MKTTLDKIIRRTKEGEILSVSYEVNIDGDVVYFDSYENAEKVFNKVLNTAEYIIADKNAKRGGEGATEREGMSLNDYQQQAMTTCLPSSANDCYMLFGLVEEVGELCGKISKAIRKNYVEAINNDLFIPKEIKGELHDAIKSEISDCLWFVAGLCRQFGWTLEEVAQYNLDKLAARKQSNTIVSHTDH